MRAINYTAANRRVSSLYRGIEFMNTEMELKLLQKIEELRKEVDSLKGTDENQIPTYQYSKMRGLWEFLGSFFSVKY